MPDETPSDAELGHRSLVWAAGIIVVLVTFYAGAYYATAERWGFHSSAVYCVPGRPHSHAVHSKLAILFMPIHWLDRRLRPGTWN